MVIEVQVSSSFWPFCVSSFSRYGLRTTKRARQRLVVVDVGRRRLDAGRGAAADDRDRGGRRDRQLVGEALLDAEVGGVRAGAALLGQRLATASSHWPRMCLNIFLFHTLAITASSGMLLACRKEWKPITPRPTERSRMAA